MRSSNLSQVPWLGRGGSETQIQILPPGTTSFHRPHTLFSFVRDLAVSKPAVQMDAVRRSLTGMGV